MKKKRFLVGILLLLCLSLSLAGCEKKAAPYERSGVVMDTVVTLSASGPEAKAAVDESFDRLAELEAMASTTIDTSDAARIKAAAGRDYVEVHPEIYHMLEVSQQYSELSQGAWDITTGPLIELWGIGTDHQRLPAPEEVAAAQKLVDYHKLHLRAQDHSVMLEQAGMSVDFGGIAKGFAIDEIRKIYEAHGIQDGLINMGSSSIYGVGKNKDGKPWNIGIKHPRKEDKDAYLAIISLENTALSTSGDYERCFIQDGRRYHHIFDPKTGYPADHGVMSDTIVIDGSVPDSGMISDLLTTAVFVLGSAPGKAFLESLPGEIQGEVTSSDFKVWCADGFEQKLQKLHKDFTIEK